MRGWIAPGIVLALVFVATRLPALKLQDVDTDVNLYARYAAEGRAAARLGESFYDLHRRRAQEDMEHSRGAQGQRIDEYQIVEYPPLAVTFMSFPAWLIDEPFDAEFPAGRQPRYARAYVWLMAACDAAVLLLIVYLVRRLFPTETSLEQLQRCLVYVVCTWPLYGVLYTRLDMGLALLVTAALALLVSRLHWSLALAALAVAIHFKLMPAVLAPLWIVASLPVSALSDARLQLFWRLVQRTAVLVGFGLAILLPYYCINGPVVLEFLAYHRERGIEIESTWASLLLPWHAAAGSWTVYHSHGGFNVDAPPAAFVAAAAMPFMAVLVAAMTILFVAAARRRYLQDKVDACVEKTFHGSGETTIAQRWPQLVVSASLLLLLISIVANKVFSAQYLLWVVPLVPLVDFRPGRRWLFFLAAFAACFLTMRIFPDCMIGEIVRQGPANEGLPTIDGPTLYGAMLLIARNGLCVLLTTVLAVSLWRERSAQSTCAFQNLLIGRSPLRPAITPSLRSPAHVD